MDVHLTPINVSSTRNIIIHKDGTTSIAAPPKSDIYTSPGPPSIFVYTAPFLYRRVKLSTFVSAQVTVSAKWQAQFDQGGVVFMIPTRSNPEPDSSNASVSAELHPAWIKAGIETNSGIPSFSVASVGHVVNVTLRLTRDQNSLKIWHIKDGKEFLARKIPWVFLHDDKLGDDALVGIYAARPDPDGVCGDENLEATFRGLAINIEM